MLQDNNRKRHGNREALGNFGSEFNSFLGFRILEPSGIPDSTCKNFPDFRIRFPLYREIYKVSRVSRFSGLVGVLILGISYFISHVGGPDDDVKVYSVLECYTWLCVGSYVHM